MLAALQQVAFRSIISRLSLALAFVAAALSPCARAGQVAIEDTLPASTLAALVIPDPGAARTAATQTKLGVMFAQPEMQAFLRPPLDQIKKSYLELQQRNPLIPKLEDLEAGLLNSALAVSVYARPNNPALPAGVLVSIIPKDIEALRRALPPPTRPMLAEGAALPLGAGVSAPGLAVTHGAILFCIPGSDLPAITAALQNPPAGTQSFADLPEFKVLRDRATHPAALFCAAPGKSIETILAALRRASDPNLQRAASAIATLGIEDCSGLSVTLGFSADSPITDLSLTFAKPPQDDIYSLLAPAPAALDVASLKIAEPNAPYVAAGWFNFKNILPLVQKAVDAIGPDEAHKLADGLRRAPELLGANLQTELLDNLAGDIVVAQTEIDTAAPLSFAPGMVYSLGLKDAATFEHAFSNMMAAVAQKFGAAEAQFPLAALQMPHITKLQYKGKDIYYLKSFVLAGVGAFAVRGGRLLYGTTLSALRRGIDQLDKPDNILSNKDFQAALARVSGKPYSADALPQFAYAADMGTGAGSLFLSLLDLAALTGPVAAAAEIPAPPAADAENDQDDADAGIPRNPAAVFFKGPVGKVLLDVGHSIDLGLWPDEGFFNQHRFATAMVATATANGLFSRTELPPPQPKSSMTKALVVIAGVSIVASLTLPVLARARESARRTASASNMSQMAKACMMYADVPANGGLYPDDPAKLFPNYVNDARVFINPSWPDEVACYIYVAGSGPEDTTNMICYENIPEPQARNGRNVLYAGGNVEWVSDETFKKLLGDTEAAITKAGRKMTRVPIDHAAIDKHAKW